MRVRRGLGVFDIQHQFWDSMSCLNDMNQTHNYRRSGNFKIFNLYWTQHFSIDFLKRITKIWSISIYVFSAYLGLPTGLWYFEASSEGWKMHNFIKMSFFGFIGCLEIFRGLLGRINNKYAWKVKCWVPYEFQLLFTEDELVFLSLSKSCLLKLLAICHVVVVVVVVAAISLNGCLITKWCYKKLSHLQKG